MTRDTCLTGNKSQKRNTMGVSGCNLTQLYSRRAVVEEEKHPSVKCSLVESTSVRVLNHAPALALMSILPRLWMLLANREEAAPVTRLDPACGENGEKRKHPFSDSS
jgi:hypothetical protein